MKNRISLAVALLVIVPLIAQLSAAQLFPNAPWNRGNRGRVQSVQSCPGGVCPTTTSVYQSRQTFAPAQSSRHWTYPGNIDNHLRTGHGVEPTGLTHEEKLLWHDALHEGRAYAPVIQKASTTIRVSQPVAPQPTPQPKQSDRLPASDSTFGLSYATEPIPNHVLGQVETRTEVRSEFKKSLLDAISAARKADRITFREAVQLRVACISPAFVERAQELAVTQLAFSGESSEHVPTVDGVIQVDGINWEGLGKFLEVFIPLLIQLIKAFGL